MSAVDIVLLVLLGFAAYRGYRKGLLVSLVGIVAFMVGLVAAFVLLDWGVQFLEKYISGLQGLIPYLAFLMIFGGVAVLINIAGTAIKKSVETTLIGSLDNAAGAFVGILKWAFGLSLIIWLSQHVGIELPQDVQQQSMVYHWVQPIAPMVIDVFSEYLPFLKGLFESIKERLQPSIP